MRAASRLGTAQEVAIGAASAASAAFGAQTYQVRVVATSACRVGDGTPAALAADSYLPADRPEYFTCTPGQRIAVIQESAGGKLSVTEVV
jgi:hypothetical protein